MLTYYDAIANISGSELAPEVRGTVKFLGIADGSWVEVEVFGLPEFSEGIGDKPQIAPFAFHLHESDTCGAAHTDTPFEAAGGHWNPDGDPHGNHAGDFPLLFSNGGTAKMLFFTNRFHPEDIVGMSVVIHSSPDTSEESGRRIACGAVVSALSPVSQDDHPLTQLR